MLRKSCRIFLAAFFLFFAQDVSAATFSVGSGAFKAGCPVSVPIMIDTQTKSSDAANIIVHYSPADVDILDANAAQAGIQINTGMLYSAYADNVVDVATGTIRLTGFSIGTSFNGSGAFGAIPFTSKPGVTSTTFSVEYVSGATTDSNVAEAVTSNDLLNAVASGTATFSAGPCTADTTPPTVVSMTPSNGATNVPLDANISFRVTDNQAGVKLSTLRVDVLGVTYTSGGATPFTSTGSALDYTITVDPAADFPANTEVIVRVNAEDLDGNVMPTRQFSFNRPPTPPPVPPTCEQLGCFATAPVCSVPPIACAEPSVCGNGICDSSETPVTCRFDCAVAPTGSLITSDAIIFTALDGSLRLPNMQNEIHVFPGVSYGVGYVPVAGSTPDRVTLLAATGEYSLIATSGGMFETKISAPLVTGSYNEVLRVETRGVISTYPYRLIVDAPFVVVDDAGKPVSSASVSVYRLTAAGRAALSSAELHRGNPSSTSSDGTVAFMATPGVYALSVSADGFVHGETDPTSYVQATLTGRIVMRKSLVDAVSALTSEDTPLDVKLNAIASSAVGALSETLFRPIQRAQKDPAAQAQAAQSLTTLVLATVAVLGGGAAAYGLLPLLLLFGLLYVYQRVMRRAYDEKKEVTIADLRRKIAAVVEYLDIPLFAVTAAVALIRPTPFVFALLAAQVIGFATFSALRKVVK